MLTVDLFSIYLLSRVDIVIRYIEVDFTFGLPDYVSLRSRRLEVVGTRKNGRVACLPRARPFSLSPATSKRLLRRLGLCSLYRRIRYIEARYIEVLFHAFYYNFGMDIGYRSLYRGLR